ncbi:UNKNOWN [Stylonychia lemnae]|uniref:Uncharacterized protein n=1 Tax=Stylonychia lemnae TaxID=5949 RepID=A0A078BED3_STYLE|nr:UNKNOWN [Stylonychia lemnae]|eukprot:CDW91507.1 UNKNOWN [Stylonychia lemnae]
MRKIFGSALSSSSKNSTNLEKIAVITNYSACPLGQSLLKVLSQDYRVVAISYDDKTNDDINQNNEKTSNIIRFKAHLSEQDDRNRLIAFLKSENMVISRMVNNQPFMIRPTPLEKQIEEEKLGLRDHQAANQRVEELKEKIRILIETPLFLNGDLIDQNVIDDEARILQIIQKQYGIFSLQRASQVNLRKCLKANLEQKMIGISALTPGLYSPQQVEYMRIDKSNGKDQNDTKHESDIEYLNPDVIAIKTYEKLLGKNAVDLKEYVMKTEWDAYADLNLGKAPKIYSDVNL